MIHSVLMFNNQGTPRLMKHYTSLPLDEQKELYDQIYTRIKLGEAQGQKTNFLTTSEAQDSYQIVYKKYSGLYFVLLVDPQESPLRMLDLIHSFVECLNLCLEEMIVGGIVVEIDRHEVVRNIDDLNGGHSADKTIEENVKRFGDTLFNFASGGFGAWSSSR